MRAAGKASALRALTSHGAAAGAVRWNPLQSGLLAAAHASDLRLWDLRRPSDPVCGFRAHVAPLASLDWCPTREYELATCSSETKVKVLQPCLSRFAPSPDSFVRCGT